LIEPSPGLAIRVFIFVSLFMYMGHYFSTPSKYKKASASLFETFIKAKKVIQIDCLSPRNALISVSMSRNEVMALTVLMTI